MPKMPQLTKEREVEWGLLPPNKGLPLLHTLVPCVDGNLFPMIYKSIFQIYPSGTSHFSNDIHLYLQIFPIYGLLLTQYSLYQI